MAMINYADKVALNSNSNIADINKVNATDMNELKNAFNNQVAQGWYKTGINPTFTFVSYDSETLTGVVSSDLDMTPYLNVGMKVKFTQNSATKYAIITAITSTQLSLFLGTDYSINSSAISNTYYSMLKTPYGFPLEQTKWRIFYNNTTNQATATPENFVWKQAGTLQKVIPPGAWRLELKVLPGFTTDSGTDTGGYVTLSTTTNSVGSLRLTSLVYFYDNTTNAKQSFNTVILKDNVEVATPTTFYVLMKPFNQYVTACGARGDYIDTQIIAECAYL